MKNIDDQHITYVLSQYEARNISCKKKGGFGFGCKNIGQVIIHIQLEVDG